MDPALLTADAMELVTRPGVDIVVEVIGGIEPARSLLLAAMKNGKSVVSANKALLAEDGATLHQAARDNGADLYYEAAVGGAIPLLRPLRESLAGDAVRRCSGSSTARPTTSWTGWTPPGPASPTRWRRRRRWVTPSPTRRRTSRASTPPPRRAILAGLAFHTRVTAADVHREGITGVTAADIASARALGHVVKLLAICERRRRAACRSGSTRR